MKKNIFVLLFFMIAWSTTYNAYGQESGDGYESSNHLMQAYCYLIQCQDRACIGPNGIYCVPEVLITAPPCGCDCVNYYNDNPCQCQQNYAERNICECNERYAQENPSDCGGSDDDEDGDDDDEDDDEDDDDNNGGGSTTQDPCSAEAIAKNPCGCESTKNTCDCIIFRREYPCNCLNHKLITDYHKCQCEAYAKSNVCKCHTMSYHDIVFSSEELCSCPDYKLNHCEECGGICQECEETRVITIPTTKLYISSTDKEFIHPELIHLDESELEYIYVDHGCEVTGRVVHNSGEDCSFSINIIPGGTCVGSFTVPNDYSYVRIDKTLNEIIVTGVFSGILVSTSTHTWVFGLESDGVTGQYEYSYGDSIPITNHTEYFTFNKYSKCFQSCQK